MHRGARPLHDSPRPRGPSVGLDGDPGVEGGVERVAAHRPRLRDRAHRRARDPASPAHLRDGRAGAPVLSDGADGRRGYVPPADVRDRRARLRDRPDRHAQRIALVTLTDRLVSSAAALELLPPTPLGAGERARLERVAADCAEIRRALDGVLVAPSEPAADGGSPARGGSGIVPVLGELEHVAGLMRQALGPDGAVVDVPPAGATGLFVPDALTNPAYVRYALKGTLAVMICYV